MEKHNPPDTLGNGTQGGLGVGGGTASPGEGALRCGGADPESPAGNKRVALQPLCGARWTHISKEENQKAILLVLFLKPYLKAPKENLWLGEEEKNASHR